MRPVEFPQQTMVLAKDQPQYQPFPVHYDGDLGACIGCFELDESERATLAAGGRLWLWQYTFGRPVQPVTVTTEHPWGEPNPACNTGAAEQQPQGSTGLADQINQAVAYSHNFATAKPDIGSTEKEHILGLCALLGKCGAALSVDGPSVSEDRCESGDPNCGPAECQDDDGTRLCRKCYDGLEPETRTQRAARERGLSVVPAAPGVEP